MFLKLLLAIVCALFGIMMILIAPRDAGIPWVYYGFGAFCLLITAACFTDGRSQEFIVSLLATAVFGIGVWYLVVSFNDLYASSGRKKSGFIGAIGFMLTFGLGAANLVRGARFGFRTEPDGSTDEM